MMAIKPHWPAPATIHSLVTTRQGGVSSSPYDSLNLGDHVGDQPSQVIANRQTLRNQIPTEPIWLKQTHSTIVSTPLSRQSTQGAPVNADASVSNIPGEVLVIMTADCLPVLFTNSSGTVIGAAHAGWRGLCAGVLENTITELLRISDDKNPADLMAWLGPAIGPAAFEVGEDVVTAFTNSGFTVPESAFKPITNKAGKYLADIYLLARARLEASGVSRVSGGQYCTVRDQEQFFSYRRDGETGRFASAIWITK